MKAYRPIALENTLEKVLESVIAELITYFAETNHLLPRNHYSARPGKSTEDVMLVLTENIYSAWKESKVYSAVFMDIAGAFNNVHHDRLIHTLGQKRIPPKITQWIASFLRHRSTKLQVNGVESEEIPIYTGIPQGSPLSPILYIFYNSGLLDIPGPQKLGLGFIDDIAYGVKGATANMNATMLQQMLNKAETWR